MLRPPTPGPIAFVGGDEFRRACDPIDRALLARAGGPGATVAILPTGATNVNPEAVGAFGVVHFERLGAAPQAVLVVDEASAARPNHAAAISGAGLIYLAGGDPAYMLETLRGSLAWEAVRAAHRRGALVAGSGAGAMVLGGAVWGAEGWLPGLGLAPSLAVLPHHASLAKRWDVGVLLSTLPPGLTLLGVDDATALLLPEAVVLGAGLVSVYAAGRPQSYAAGARGVLNVQPGGG